MIHLSPLLTDLVCFRDPLKKGICYGGKSRSTKQVVQTSTSVCCYCSSMTSVSDILLRLVNEIPNSGMDSYRHDDVFLKIWEAGVLIQLIK